MSLSVQALPSGSKQRFGYQKLQATAKLQLHTRHTYCKQLYDTTAATSGDIVVPKAGMCKKQRVDREDKKPQAHERSRSSRTHFKLTNGPQAVTKDGKEV